MTVLRANSSTDLSDFSDDDDGGNVTLLRLTPTEIVLFDSATRETAYVQGNYQLADGHITGGSITGLVVYNAGNVLEGSVTGFHVAVADFINMSYPTFLARIFMNSDQLYGSWQNDTLTGLYGNDLIQGGDGADLLYGNQNDDTIEGNQGNDVIYGGQGSDSIMGNDGADNISGNREADVIVGGSGDDTLTGNLGQDVIAGESGNDYIAGQRDNDTVSGGEGADIFAFFSEGGADVITDFQKGADKIAIALNINNSGIASFGQLSITADSAGAAVIHLGNDDQVTLSGVAPLSLDASDVIFF